MSEKEIKTMSENKEVSPSPEKKKNKSFLVIYSIALFLFAAVLIGLSYLSQLSQARVAADTNKKIDELSVKTEISTGVQTRLEQVSAKNDELEKENATLFKENEELKKQMEEFQNAEKQAEATEYIWKIVKAHDSKKKKECISLIDELNKKELRDHLSKAALSELVRIETLLSSI